MRNLKKQIEKIHRKAAFKIVEEQVRDKDAPELVINSEDLRDYCGAPVFTADRMYDTTPPGVVMGLSWTQMGGSTLYIESIIDSVLKPDGKPAFQRTGQMVYVMKESSTIGYTYAKAFLADMYPKNTFFEHGSIYMHIPEGATPKDGNLWSYLLTFRTLRRKHYGDIADFSSLRKTPCP